jgi:predicted phosphodiesterase
MRILALYDVHGNDDALAAVLADPRAADPDAVVVGGDTVPGPFALEALARLDALAVPVHRVRGNGEREVAEAAAGDAVDETAALTAAAVGPERAADLGAQPLTVALDGILFCHATPHDDMSILTRISTPERWADAFGGVSERLVVAGHTHQQDDRRIGDVRVVNAGSVGLPYEGDGAARWLWIADGEPQLCRTEYDAAAAGRRMLDAGWPDNRSVGAALVEPLAPDVITRLFEERATA